MGRLDEGRSVPRKAPNVIVRKTKRESFVWSIGTMLMLSLREKNFFANLLVTRRERATLQALRWVLAWVA